MDARRLCRNRVGCPGNVFGFVRLRYRDHTYRPALALAAWKLERGVLFEPVDRPSLDFSANEYDGRAYLCQSLGHGETKAARCTGDKRHSVAKVKIAGHAHSHAK